MVDFSYGFLFLKSTVRNLSTFSQVMNTLILFEDYLASYNISSPTIR